MADSPIAYKDLPPAPTAPALPTQRQDEDADAFTARVAQAYRHGNIWAVSGNELAVLLLRQLSANEPLRPETREEAHDILGRLQNLTVTRSQFTPGYKAQYILTEELRNAIGTKLASEGKSVVANYACAAG